MQNDVTFVTVVESGHLEAMALRLAESVRRWGGCLANASFLFVKPRRGAHPSRRTRQQMQQLNVDYLAVDYHSNYSWYDFLNKPLALDAASKFVQTPIVCWLDADVLILNEPALLSLEQKHEQFDFAACASDINLGTTGPGSRFEAYWQTMCQILGISFDSLGMTWIHRDSVSARTYFNGGVLSFRVDSGFAGEYLRTVLTALDARIASSTEGIFMHEQMSIGITAKKLKLRINELPWEYNFSSSDLNLAGEAESAAARMTAFHYHGSFWPEEYDDMCRRMSVVRPDRIDYIKSLGPLNAESVGLIARLRGKVVRRLRQRQQNRYVVSCRSIDTRPLATGILECS